MYLVDKNKFSYFDPPALRGVLDFKL